MLSERQKRIAKELKANKLYNVTWAIEQVEKMIEAQETLPIVLNILKNEKAGA